MVVGSRDAPDVNTEVDDAMIVDPKEFVVEYTITLLDTGGGTTMDVKSDDVTIVEPRESVVAYVTMPVEVESNGGVFVKSETEDVTMVEPNEFVVE